MTDEIANSEPRRPRQALRPEERAALLALRHCRIIRARNRPGLPFMMLYSRGHAVFEAVKDKTGPAIDFRLTRRGELVAEAIAPVSY